MAVLCNEVNINTPPQKIWEILADATELEKFDEEIKQSVASGMRQAGIGARRKLFMQDGKNWFELKVIMWEPPSALGFELTDGTFPVTQLKQIYTFESIDGHTRLRQIMKYKIKYGFLGKLLDLLIVRRQSNNGIKKFMAGLKSYAENK